MKEQQLVANERLALAPRSTNMASIPTPRDLSPGKSSLLHSENIQPAQSNQLQQGHIPTAPLPGDSTYKIFTTVRAQLLDCERNLKAKKDSLKACWEKDKRLQGPPMQGLLERLAHYYFKGEYAIAKARDNTEDAIAECERAFGAAVGEMSMDVT